MQSALKHAIWLISPSWLKAKIVEAEFTAERLGIETEAQALRRERIIKYAQLALTALGIVAAVVVGTVFRSR